MAEEIHVAPSPVDFAWFLGHTEVGGQVFGVLKFEVPTGTFLLHVPPKLLEAFGLRLAEEGRRLQLQIPGIVVPAPTPNGNGSRE